MSKLTDQLISHWRSLASERGEAVAIKRSGTIVLAGITAVPGTTNREVLSDQNKSVFTEQQDWIFLASDIAAWRPPIAGDTISLTVNGVLRQWRVSKEINGTWRPSDAMEVMIRVYTKKVS